MSNIFFCFQIQVQHSLAIQKEPLNIKHSPSTDFHTLLFILLDLKTVYQVISTKFVTILFLTPAILMFCTHLSNTHLISKQILSVQSTAILRSSLTQHTTSLKDAGEIWIKLCVTTRIPTSPFTQHEMSIMERKFLYPMRNQSLASLICRNYIILVFISCSNLFVCFVFLSVLSSVLV